MKKRLFIVNFKTYKKATGNNALKLAKKLNKVKGNIAIAAEATDINLISKNCKNLKVFSQYIDPYKPDRHTGGLTAYSVKKSGAKGTLINHSEKPLKLKDIQTTIKLAKKNKLTTVVCAKNEKIAKKILKFKPDYIAIEPPSLISTKTSISKAKPQLITKAVKTLCKKPKCDLLLVGAGIHNKQDVKKAFELGANGILVSSAIVKSKQPSKLLKELILASR